MNLYYGDNNAHEFWESEDRRFLIIRNHGEQVWFALSVAGSYEQFGTARRPRTIANRIQRHYGIPFTFESKRRWVRKRKNARHMQLEEHQP